MATQYQTFIEDGDDEFFTAEDGGETVVGMEDLQEVVPDREKPVLELEARYWLNKPYAFACIFRSLTDDKRRYVLVEPQLTEAEQTVLDTVRRKLRQSLDPDAMEFSARRSHNREEYLRDQRSTIREQVYELYSDLNLLEEDTSLGLAGKSIIAVANTISRFTTAEVGREVAPLTDEQMRRLNYYLIRDFVGFGQIDALMKDTALEDIRCPRYESEVFVVHNAYGRLSTNVEFGVDDLDRFMASLTERVERGISRQQPLVDVTLPDGSRAQLTYKDEVSPDGSNFSIRLFNDVPFTPVDQINWGSFDIQLVTYLWILMHGGKSVLFSGGTGSGKTTALNAFSMCIPSSKSVISIEDTREVELPHQFWTPLVTRSGFQNDENEITEYQLLRGALRMNPDHIVMGEIRGKEGRTLLQAAATGHAVSSTFHSGSPSEVLDRFTSDPINVPEQMFRAFDVITSQTKTELATGTNKAEKERRCREIVEIEDDPVTTGTNTGQVELHTVWNWDRQEDTFYRANPTFSGQLLDVGREEWGLTKAQLEREITRRKTVLAYLIDNGLTRYSEVAATLQAYMTAPEDVLALMARDRLGEKVQHLREMKHVNIAVDPRLEEQIDRPSPSAATQEQVERILSRAESTIFPEYVDRPASIAAGVGEPEIVAEETTPVDIERGSELIMEAIAGEEAAEELDFDAEVDADASELEFAFEEDLGEEGQPGIIRDDGNGHEESVSAPLLGSVKSEDDIDVRDPRR